MKTRAVPKRQFIKFLESLPKSKIKFSKEEVRRIIKRVIEISREND